MTVFPWSFGRHMRHWDGPPARRLLHPHTAVARFETIAPHANRARAALRPDHRALRDATTLFLRQRISPAAAPRALVDGHNNCKIGRTISKGPWRGLPIYTLTLEERATCPRSCHLWSECYGNAIPFTRRLTADATLVPAIDRDLVALMARHRRGLVVRLHVLGDFVDLDYLRAWLCWMVLFPWLRVFGFTAHPRDSLLGATIERMNQQWPERWVIRFSVPPASPVDTRQATTIWTTTSSRTVPEGIVCPAQTKATTACATCGLCWAPAAAEKRIVFIGHGMNNTGRKGRAAAI